MIRTPLGRVISSWRSEVSLKNSVSVISEYTFMAWQC